MKKLLVLLFLISTQVFAQTWPNLMYTTDNLFTRQFSGLRSYIQNLKINYPFSLKDNKLVFYSDNGNNLEEIFKLIVITQKKENYIKETVIFDALVGSKEKFTFERWGESVRPLGVNKLTSFDFSVPQRVEAFRIEFQVLKLFQYVEYDQSTSKSHYKLFDYGLEIHHYDEIQKEKLYSKLWYQCDVCSGEPLVAIMDTRETHYGNMSYYFGNPLKFVTPKEFYAKANRSYLSGIFREFQGISNKGIGRFGWPRN